MKKTKEESIVKKSPLLYCVMLIIWICLAVAFWYYFIPKIIEVPYIQGFSASKTVNIVAKIFLMFNALFISYFWLNGVKDFLYVIWYYVFKNRLQKKYLRIINTDVSNVNDKVLMLYCTCNDFDEYSLKLCLKQKYKNVKTVILDDSTDDKYKTRIDEFSKIHGLKVVRRENRIGFKAGNINNYLNSEEFKKEVYDYVVILDSDEIIPENYIKESLKYFYAVKNVGIVQANHISDRNRNFFMKLFHVGVNAHWPTYQTMKHFYGFSTMLGHGAMIKRECYEKAGGFPPLVAEDLCLSIEARNAGYIVAFAPNIICREEYPIDYIAFKKRHSKWTQGNLEFIKKYTGKIARSKMKWFEKLDIVLFTYNLPLTAIFATFIFVNLLVMPLLNVNLAATYSPWMLVPTIIFFFSPMLNDFITWAFRLNPFRTLLYTVMVIVLYGSMLTTSLISAFLGMVGKKAKFIVTPKSSTKMNLTFALKAQWKEFVFSTILMVISIMFQGGILPIVLISFTGYISLFLVFFSNKKYDVEQTDKIDEKTSKITTKLNKLYNYNPDYPNYDGYENDIEYSA